jgi:phosphopantetheinyl transferase
VEYLDEGFVLFPIRIRELTLYRENLKAGERAECRLKIQEVAPRQLRADMDIVAPDGALWMRIVGWEDWRFYWARNFYDFWRFPNLGYVSDPLSLELADGDAEIECRRMAPFGEMGSSIWENLWAHLICSREELSAYHAMPEGKRRTEWIFGRAAAKDAVRAWAKRTAGLDLYPADVVIVQDGEGKPTVRGHWVGAVGGAPCVSISHKAAYAVAAAGRSAVGIDLETITQRDESFVGAAFDAGERNLLQNVNGRGRDEWIARAWSAKEAAGKALGVGLSKGPGTVRIQNILEVGDDVRIACHAGNGTLDAPQTLVVHSFRDGDFVLGLAVHEEATP